MRPRFIILLLMCLLLSSNPVIAEEKSTITELDQLADEALQLTRFGRFADAKVLLERFGELFSAKGIMEKPFTMDELRVVTAAHHNALGALTSTNLDPEERIRRVTAFRLATDAVISEYQPLWSEMEKPIMAAFQEVKNAALEGDVDLYNRELNDFLATYSVIQPSIKIDIAVDKVQKLDSHITYIDQYRSDMSEANWLKELDTLEEELRTLFSDINKDDADPSVWWVMIMTGSIIVSTLTYVSFKKYRGQKKQKKRRDLND